MATGQNSADLHGHSSDNKDKSRPAQKIFADLKFLMIYMEQHITVPEEITVASVDAMCEEANVQKSAASCCWRKLLAM